MEGIANVVAVIDLSTKVASLCFKYCQSVRNAGPEIKSLLERAERLKTTLEVVRELLDGPLGSQLKCSQKLRKALDSTQEHLGDAATKLESRLSTGGKSWSISRLQALRWPFDSKSIIRSFENLQLDQTFLDSALQVDQTAEILDIHIKLVMSALPVAKDAAFDSQANEHDPRCHPGTRVSLLAEIYRELEAPNEKSIFWLQGMAGTGKSTIARSIAAHVSEMGNVVAASFFFKKGEGDRNKAALLFTTISHQLVQRLPFLSPHVANAIKEDPAIVNKSMKDQFQKLIIDPLKRCKNIPGFPALIVVVIDALDECSREDDAATIIRILPRATELTSFRLRFFVTSRLEFHIRRSFKKIRATDFILHEIPKADISKDISTFLHFKLASIRDDFNDNVGIGSELPPDWPDPTLFKELVKRAVPLFIFASAICDFIADINCGDPDEQLHRLLEYSSTNSPSQLHTTYLPILNQLLLESNGSGSKPRSDGMKIEILEWFRELVGAIIMLADPLPIASLARLLGKHQRNIESRLNGLHSVLHIPNDPNMPVKLFHLSFRDFLTDRKHRNDNPFWIDEQETHAKLADRCLQVLSTGRSIRMDVCNLRMPGRPRAELTQKEINTQLPAEVQYACIYWVYHLNESARPLLDDGQVYRFLTTHLLHWLEAIAILGRIRETVRMFDNLLDLADGKRSPTLWAFLRDAQRGILTNRSIIDEYPLQLYCSAIIFAPETSEVRSIYRSEFPAWITLLPQVDVDWNPCTQTFEGIKGRDSIAIFSPDGSQIIISSSNSVKFWDVAAGDCTMSLNICDNVGLDGIDDCCINSIAISPDGDLLAVATGKYGKDFPTLQLWDVMTGTCILKFSDHKSQVNAVAFSPDGTFLASAYGHFSLTELRPIDAVVRLWDIATESCIQTLAGYSHPIQAISFSPNGKQVASVSSEGTVMLWNIETGIPIEPPFTGFKSVAFSPNGRQIALPQYEWVIKIRDLETGKCVTTHDKHHEGSITSVAFSPDGSYLASASKDYTVKLWDVVTGECVKTFEGHLSSVNSVAYSLDGTSLASASGDSTVKVWDIMSNRITGFEGHDTPPLLITFSPDGNQLLSAVTSKLTRESDTTIESSLELYSHHPHVKQILLSPDCSKLVSTPASSTEFYTRIKTRDIKTGAYIRTFENQPTLAPSTTDAQYVIVWDTTSGDCLWKFKTRCSVSTVSFSMDSNWLAVGYFGVITVFEAASGICILELEYPGKWTTAVALSYDNTCLASAVQDGYLDIWSIATCKCFKTFCTSSSDITSVEVSRDGGWLAAGSSEGSFHLWDVKTGQNISTLALGSLIYGIAFDAAGLYPKINTEIGTFALRGSIFAETPNVAQERACSQPLTLKRQGIGMTKCGAWITWDSNKALWLPPVFRHSGRMSSALTESTVALSNRSGRLTIISISSPNEYYVRPNR